MITCPECQMCYVEGLPDNEKEHNAYHDQVVNGVVARPAKSDHVIWQEGNQRITLVTSYSSRAQRERAEKVASLANLETHYDRGIYHAAETPDKGNIHLLLYHRGNRVVGLIVLERRPRIWRFRWRGEDKPEWEELQGHEPMWSVVFVWVHKKIRRQGVARSLLTEAMRILRIGQQDVAWYTEFSDEGRAFVRSLYPDEFYVAK